VSYPNAVIAGAPKCGTTSIFDYLTRHPEICGSTVKETRYLIDRGYSLFNKKRNYYKDGLKGYEYYFNHCESEQYRLEVTPDYIYQQLPIKIFQELPETPKIIFILRRPSDRIFSLYQFAVNNMAVLDASITFSDYVQLLRNDRSYFHGRHVLQNAIEHSKYINYLKKWQAVFKENVYVFLFEDLRKDPCKFMKTIANDLDITGDFFESLQYEKRNVTYKVRNQRLHSIQRRLANVGYISHRPRAVLSRCVIGLVRKIYRLANIEDACAKRSGEDLKVLEELDLEFHKYNEELARCFGINIALWQNSQPN